MALAEYRLLYGDEGEVPRLLQTELRRAGPKAALKAYAKRTPQLLHMVADTAFDDIREDPRYKDLLRRIGIPMAGTTR